MKQLTESEVSIKSLVGIFDSAFVKVLDETSESFWVQGENLKTKIKPDEKRKYLRFSIVYQLAVKPTLAEAIRLANTINGEYLFIRFSIYESEGDILVASDYYMTYEEGLVSFHLIKIAKRFEELTVEALREYFKDYL
jgi:hypothetical protein